MLVLTRSLNEEVLISGGIRVVVLETRSGQVKLGFDAPKSVVVMRAELEGAADATR